jgi:uncharacterized protein YndB with AHSA1/START domain
MDKLRRTISIAAPRAHVWNVMLEDSTYRDWTSAFSPGSYYKGDWSQGSPIVFAAPNPEGPGELEMTGRIHENRLHEFLSIEFAGESGGAPGQKAAAYENYTFSDRNGGTELTIEMDIEPERKEHFETIWTNALARLKEIAEKAV